jgi:membrane-associated phospholipid phosphatase
VDRVATRAVNALLAAAACVAGLVALYLAAFELAPTERADAQVLDGFMSLNTASTWPAASFVSHLFNFRPYAVAVVIVVAAALWLGRTRMALAVGAIILGANVTTPALKLLTAAPRAPGWLPEPSWPSGHVTAATSLALCVVLIAPAALRRCAVVAGALGVLATAYAILVLGSHHPSDVAGGMLVAGAWTGVVVAALERGRPATAVERRTRRLAHAAAALSLVVLLVVVLALAPLGPRLADHTTFLTGALLLAACAAAIPAAAATLLAPPARGR